MSYSLRSDFDKFNEEAAKRQVFDFLLKNQTSQKVAQFIGQNKQPEPHLIRDEPFA